MNEPTQKQIDYAEAIAEAVGLQLPDEFTKQAYSEFISEWKDELHTGSYEEADYWRDVR